MPRAGILLLLLWASAAFAGNGDEAALALADKTTAEPSAAHACNALVEAAANETMWSDGVAPTAGGRLSLDFRCAHELGGSVSARLSNRVDEIVEHGSPGQIVDTLKEAYLSWQYAPNALVDVGRINVREGVAVGYNPTDYFRADSLRTIISLDPDSLREERLGSVMARSQFLWNGGSLMAIYSPGFHARPSDSSFNPDFGATNPEDRWLIALSETLAPGLAPQWSIFGTAHESPQAGLDLTYLLGKATIAYVEWSGGSSQSDLARAGVPGGEAASAFHQRASVGLTYTTASNLSLTLEYEFDGAAPDATEWEALRSGPIAEYGRFRKFAGAQQELTTRANLFGYLRWENALIRQLDLTAFTRFDIADRSRVTWAEVRYHWPQVDLAVQWQRDDGTVLSDLAAGPQRQVWLALVDAYF